MFLFKYILIRAAEVGLLYENGRYVDTLLPGRHRLVSLPWRRQEVERVDMRRKQIAINGQEILTADAISVRFNLALAYRVVNAPIAKNTVADYQEALRAAVQLILREEAQGLSLEQLLADQTALSVALLEQGRAEAASLGLELISLGVRDLLLPHPVKKALAQRFEAQWSGSYASTVRREAPTTAWPVVSTNVRREGSSSPLRLPERERIAPADEETERVFATLMQAR